MREMRTNTLLIFILTTFLVLSALIVLAGNTRIATVDEVKSESISDLTSHTPICIDGGV